jgi:hypothetical protein
LVDRLFGGSGAKSASAETRQMQVKRARYDVRNRRLRNVRSGHSRRSEGSGALPGRDKEAQQQQQRGSSPSAEVVPLWEVLQLNRSVMFDTLTGDALLNKSKSQLLRLAVDSVSQHRVAGASAEEEEEEEKHT